MSSRYTYGDSTAAEERLRLLAEVYEPTTRVFVSEVVTGPVGVAVDLGCGPGGTTAVLAGALSSGRLIGVDRSERFLEDARVVVPDAEFVAHDVTEVPFPWGFADVLYCRFVLGHLPNPTDVLASWVEQLEPGGVLAVEEYERIESPHPAVAGYLEVSEAMVASEGANLRIGPILQEVTSLPGGELIVNREMTFEPGAGRIARIFQLNLPTMRANAFVAERFGEDVLVQLESGLEDLVENAAAVTATVRQVAFLRRS
ncbi:MAG: class I SAM-dependent methyltransferase [Actinomycetota bacterium]